jgi:hypothetical protein
VEALELATSASYGDLEAGLELLRSMAAPSA